MIFLLYSTSFSVSFTIYIGLFLTSKYVLDKYIPITPKKNNCTPDTKITIHASEGHPDTGSPNASVLIIITSIAINAIKQNITPIIADITKGAVENDTIPSNAYLNNFQKLNLDRKSVV